MAVVQKPLRTRHKACAETAERKSGAWFLMALGAVMPSPVGRPSRLHLRGRKRKVLVFKDIILRVPMSSEHKNNY